MACAWLLSWSQRSPLRISFFGAASSAACQMVPKHAGLAGAPGHQQGPAVWCGRESCGQPSLEELACFASAFHQAAKINQKPYRRNCTPSTAASTREAFWHPLLLQGAGFGGSTGRALCWCSVMQWGCAVLGAWASSTEAPAVPGCSLCFSAKCFPACSLLGLPK